jgi:hypothetical protein
MQLYQASTSSAARGTSETQSRPAGGKGEEGIREGAWKEGSMRTCGGENGCCCGWWWCEVCGVGKGCVSREEGPQGRFGPALTQMSDSCHQLVLLLYRMADASLERTEDHPLHAHTVTRRRSHGVTCGAGGLLAAPAGGPGLALTRLALTRLALTRLALTRLALTRLALTRLDLTRLDLTRLDLTRLDLTRLALARLALPPPPDTPLPVTRLAGHACRFNFGVRIRWREHGARERREG